MNRCSDLRQSRTETAEGKTVQKIDESILRQIAGTPDRVCLTGGITGQRETTANPVDRCEEIRMEWTVRDKFVSNNAADSLRPISATKSLSVLANFSSVFLTSAARIGSAAWAIEYLN